MKAKRDRTIFNIGAPDKAGVKGKPAFCLYKLPLERVNGDNSN